LRDGFLPDNSSEFYFVRGKTNLRNVSMKILRQKITLRSPHQHQNILASPKNLARFLLGIKNKETFRSDSQMTFLVLKNLSNRTEFTAAPIRLSIAATLEKTLLQVPRYYTAKMPTGGNVNQRKEMDTLFPIFLGRFDNCFKR
jgi:hypothetical protein